ncbi:MAG TPA: thioredoxin family protein, partial [Cyclobacteriaceae bacterium]|nr:thioredoxin family protein [Cyclobacteriaceae bacterium]
TPSESKHMHRCKVTYGVFSMLIFMISHSGALSQNALSATFQQLDSLQKNEARPVMVFIHSDWCKYCEAMEQVTFEDQRVSKLLTQNFYGISLDAEDQRDIRLLGKTFRFKPTGNGTGRHELAEELAAVNGGITFPTLCFLNADYEIIYQHQGYLSPEQLLQLLKLLSKPPVDNL